MARKFNKDDNKMDEKINSKAKSTKKGKGSNKKGHKSSKEYDSGLMVGDRDNNPNWYFLDRMVADQTSQLSFQQLAGVPALANGVTNNFGSICVIPLNPAPGVQDSYISNSAINLAGFRLFTKLSAYTGRTATYGPQDISTMILAFGEIISKIETCRRTFGVGYQMNMRNRAYPMSIIRAMGVDPVDLFDNFANYRLRFNSIITRINQIPIPKNIAYFDKCAALYEKVYVDSPTSAMAQTIFMIPGTSWSLDETGYSGGTVLRTEEWYLSKSSRFTIKPLQTMKDYLDIVEQDVMDLLNSSSLQTVYTDLLNLATKIGVEFWRFDYLSEDYIVVPEYDQNFMLQFHNMTFMDNPYIQTSESLLSTGVTPYNDVYPDAANNQLLYNPVFATIGPVDYGIAPAPQDVILDMMSDSPTVEDRIEVTRFIGCDTGIRMIPTGQSTHVGITGAALPDHYPIRFVSIDTSGVVRDNNSVVNAGSSGDMTRIAFMTSMQWSPRLYEAPSSQLAFDGVTFGELNYWTILNGTWIKRLHDFVGLGLYDMR